MIRGVVGIVRTRDRESALCLGRGLARAGVAAVEITLTVPDAVLVIRQLAEDRQVAVPVLAGTVLRPEDVDACARAGAAGVVSPILDMDVVTRARQRRLISVPGAFTPTEVHRAVTAGASCVKVFPAACAGGPEYVRLLLGPLPHAVLMCTGGIAATDVPAYLEAGCASVGIGADLIDASALAARDVDGIARHARTRLAGIQGKADVGGAPTPLQRGPRPRATRATAAGKSPSAI